MARGISGRRQHDSNRIDNEGADCRVQCPEMRFEEPYLQHHDRKQREQNETRGLPHIGLLSGYWVVVAPTTRRAWKPWIKEGKGYTAHATRWAKSASLWPGQFFCRSELLKRSRL